LVLGFLNYSQIERTFGSGYLIYSQIERTFGSGFFKKKLLKKSEFKEALVLVL